MIGRELAFHLLAETQPDDMMIDVRGEEACCMSCMFDQIERDEEGVNEGYRGVVFWTDNDREDVRAGKFRLCYCTLPGSDLDDAGVARTMVEHLRSIGVRVEWNGDVTKKIIVNIADGPA